MKLIIEDTIAAQLPIFTAMAREVADARLVEFKERILERFESLETANSEAFKDPDFQYLLGRAEHAFARSGDETVRETLVDLIAQRSKQNGRTRLSLSLNEAVEKAAVLTHNEFAELSLSYLLIYTRHVKARNLDTFATYLNTQVAPLLPDISTEESSYTYLESQSCATIVNFTVTDLLRPLKESYGGLFSKGFEIEKIKESLPNDKKESFDKTKLIIPCLNDKKKFQLNAISEDVFKTEVQTKNIPLSESEIKKVWGVFESTMWTKNELIENLNLKVPCIAELFRLWEATPVGRLQLTPVGIAIAHGNLVRLVKFDADLAIWIK